MKLGGISLSDSFRSSNRCRMRSSRTIAGVAKYFDPQAVNSEFLDWLGTWIAVLRDYNWPEEKRREFLKRAYRLYKVRGTVRGLKEMVELFTGGEPLIIEHYRLQTPMVLSANSTLGTSTVVGKRFRRRLVIEESSRIGEFALIETDEPAGKAVRGWRLRFHDPCRHVAARK